MNIFYFISLFWKQILVWPLMTSTFNSHLKVRQFYTFDTACELSIDLLQLAATLRDSRNSRQLASSPIGSMLAQTLVGAHVKGNNFPVKNVVINFHTTCSHSVIKK